MAKPTICFFSSTNEEINSAIIQPKIAIKRNLIHLACLKANSTEEIATITIDPDRKMPDINPLNNVWIADKSELEKEVILTSYLGTFSSKQIPIKLVFTDENGVLIGTPQEKENDHHFYSNQMVKSV